jgi:hypothetical protein
MDLNVTQLGVIEMRVLPGALVSAVGMATNLPIGNQLPGANANAPQLGAAHAAGGVVKSPNEIAPDR